MMTEADKAVSWRTLRHSLYFARLIDDVDAPVETVAAALRAQGCTTEDVPGMFSVVGLLDGLWAAREALKRTGVC
jgi:hypothetical protein